MGHMGFECRIEVVLMELVRDFWKNMGRRTTPPTLLRHSDGDCRGGAQQGGRFFDHIRQYGNGTTEVEY